MKTFDSLIAPLQAEVDGARALASVRAIATHHRIQASPGYDDAAAWLASAAAAAGLEVAVEHATADGVAAALGCVLPEGWAAESATAVLVDGDRREVIADFVREPLSLVQRSAPAVGTWPIVLLDEGADAPPPEVRGCVVLTDAAVAAVHRRAVVEQGAAGLLAYGRRLLPPVRTRDHDRDSLAYTSFWWAGDEPRGWGFVLSPARGEALAERLRRGDQLALEVDVRTRRYPARMPLVTATLPGTCAGEILLTAHLCHPRPGANDNASGVAASLEAMRALAALARTGGLPRERRTVRALWMPEITGTYAWIAADPTRASRTLAALNLDMVGEDQAACGSVQQLERAPHFAASFADELARELRHATLAPGEAPRTAEVAYSGGSDHALWIDPAIGVPCPMLIQWPDRWYHSNLDGPERCDPASLAHAARFGAAYAGGLAAATHADVAELALRLERAARRELRLALEAAEPARAVRAARLRAQTALASLGRFAIGAADEAAAQAAIARVVVASAEAVEGAFEAEIAPALGTHAAPVARARGRVPVRRQRAPIAPMRTLQVGWNALPPDERARAEAFEAAFPGGTPALDLAWYACDGRRDVTEIADRLADEGFEVPPASVEAYFEITAALGASAWRED